MRCHIKTNQSAFIPHFNSQNTSAIVLLVVPFPKKNLAEETPEKLGREIEIAHKT